MPLGIGQTQRRSQAAVELGEGDTLLLYTDGLVESRACPIDDGLELLRESVSRQHGTVDELLDRVLADLGRDAGREDDVAVIAVRPSPPRSRRSGFACRPSHGRSPRCVQRSANG